MSVWKDIRCDLNRSPDCFDMTNHGPQGYETAAELRKIGRSAGWTQRAGVGDICPACRKTASKESADV